MLLNVIFTDSAQTVVKGYFGAPQNPEDWPNQGQIETSDERWKTYYDALPGAFQELLPAPM